MQPRALFVMPTVPAHEKTGPPVREARLPPCIADGRSRTTGYRNQVLVGAAGASFGESFFGASVGTFSITSTPAQAPPAQPPDVAVPQLEQPPEHESQLE